MTSGSILPELQKARANGYAIPLFDTFDSLGADGMFQAMEECHAPGIVAVYAPLIDRKEARAFLAYLIARAEDVRVPVSIMLDHGGSFEACMKAIRLGFTDVMFDGSSLPLDENIAITRMVVRAAHAAGVNVEAELGHVGSGSEYQEVGARRVGFTDPADVERFVAETGVDILAVAIGSAHGQYQGQPALDLDLLAEIRRRTPIPLVMHGGSGLSKEQFQAAIAAGISKINIATDLFMTATEHMTKEAAAPKANFFSLTKAGTDAFQERCMYYLDIFGSTGKAA
jgi:fructose-bisphosphate aldolase, class II